MESLELTVAFHQLFLGLEVVLDFEQLVSTGDVTARESATGVVLITLKRDSLSSFTTRNDQPGSGLISSYKSRSKNILHHLVIPRIVVNQFQSQPRFIVTLLLDVIYGILRHNESLNVIDWHESGAVLERFGLNQFLSCLQRIDHDVVEFATSYFRHGKTEFLDIFGFEQFCDSAVD